jgi:APA family basic amino acid/polyamine antiporter
MTRAVAGARLRPLLGVGFGVAVAVGSMIGAGILRSPADVAARLPVPSLFLGAWVLGGVYALLGANALAELGTMLPRSGGQYVFVRHALGPYAGFLVGWNDWISTCGAVAAVALVIGEASGVLLPSLAPRVPLVAALVVSLVSLVLWRGVRESDRVQRATSVVKAVALLALVAACLGVGLWGNTTLAASSSPPLAVPTGLALAAAFVTALQGIIYAFDGWTGVLYFSEEVREPGREIPRALFGGVLSVLVLYLLLNVAFLVVLPMPDLARSTLVAASAATAVFGASGGTLVQLLVVLALPSAVVANTLMASRVAFALGRDRAAPGLLSQVNAGGSPGVALVASACAAALFLLTGTFERVIAVCAFLFVASYALSFASLFVLRRREPDAPRPYRAWAHPWSTGLVLAGSVAFLAGTVAADPRTGLVALALVALSYPVYRGMRR